MTTSSTPAPSPTGAPRPEWRVGLEWGIPSLAVLVTALAPLLVWSRLPEPMAVHFGIGGAPDAAAARGLDLVLLVVVTAVIGLGPLLATRAPMPRWSARVLIATATGGAVFLAALRLVTLRANLDVRHWSAARDLEAGTLLGVLALVALAAAVGAWLAGDRPDTSAVVGSVVPAEVPAGQAVVWTSRSASRLGVLAPTGLLIATAIGGWLVPGQARTGVMVVLPVVAIAAAMLGQVTVTVGPRGLVAGLGWFHWPRLRASIDDVAEVRVEQVEPATYGGWGLRAIPGTTAIVIRRGPGIRVERHGGRTLVVTVADATDGAAILLAHRDRAYATDDDTTE